MIRLIAVCFAANKMPVWCNGLAQDSSKVLVGVRIPAWVQLVRLKVKTVNPSEDTGSPANIMEILPTWSRWWIEVPLMSVRF